ncbi:MAG: hypothetical protein ACI9LV_000907 [Candidatus Nanohaloarchaea archaeon]|jgi:hypothetical protein
METVESVNPLRKVGEIMGRLESQDKTSADVDRIVSGQDRIEYSIYSQTLGKEISLTEEYLPDSFLEGYRTGISEASESIRYSDLTGEDNDSDFLYVGGD